MGNGGSISKSDQDQVVKGRRYDYDAIMVGSLTAI